MLNFNRRWSLKLGLHRATASCVALNGYTNDIIVSTAVTHEDLQAMFNPRDPTKSSKTCRKLGLIKVFSVLYS